MTDEALTFDVALRVLNGICSLRTIDIERTAHGDTVPCPVCNGRGVFETVEGTSIQIPVLLSRPTEGYHLLYDFMHQQEHMIRRMTDRIGEHAWSPPFDEDGIRAWAKEEE